MGDEFYAVIKLTSGEEILSLISIDDNDNDPLIILQNPITIKLLHSRHGIHVKVKSWIEMSSDDIFIIKFLLTRVHSLKRSFRLVFPFLSK